jgi:hypothetical protein
MRIIEARNVNQALPKALHLLERIGIERQSRNGPVLVSPEPVTTEYEKPSERVVFWHQRDANPAFHLYEGLYMLAGRNDLAGLVRYVKDFGRFSDDGVTLAGGYGFRWRRAFGRDQLALIVSALKADSCDRRQVLQMWDAERDLGSQSKDVCCNLMATFQLSIAGELDMLVAQRSGDILWGVYGANAVHFSLLQEYVAALIGVPVGRYHQVTSNWHAYIETLRTVDGLLDQAMPMRYAQPSHIADPYVVGEVRPTPLFSGSDMEVLDGRIRELLLHADTGFRLPRLANDDDPFVEMAYAVLRAHECWRTLPAPERYDQALLALQRADPTADFVVAMRQWVERRRAKWEAKLLRQEIPQEASA